MGRSDWIAVAVTLICAALSYYLGFPRTALYSGVIGTVILLLMVFFKSKTPLNEPHQSSHQSANPVITQQANPIVNVTIGDQHQAKLEIPAPGVIPKAKVNIKFVETKSVGSHVGHGDGVLYESPDGLGDFYVVVVCFRNDPIVGMAIQQPNIKAHIVYRETTGAEITDVPRGVWLDRYGDSTTFKSGEKKCLAVLLQSKQGTLNKLWVESYTTEHSWMAGGPSFRIRSEGLVGKIASIEISLIAGDTCLRQGRFEVQSHDGSIPKLKLMSLSEA